MRRRGSLAHGCAVRAATACPLPRKRGAQCLRADWMPQGGCNYQTDRGIIVGQRTPAEAAEAGAVGTSGRKNELWPGSGVDAQGMNADALKAHLGQRVEAVVRPVDPRRRHRLLNSRESSRPANRTSSRAVLGHYYKARDGSCS